MTDRIEPALTSEEWSRVGTEAARCIAAEALEAEVGIGSFPAIIALANDALPDDDKRKITREWVNYLRHLADDCEGEGLNDPDNEWTADAAKLRAFADALASYLPPE